MDQLKFVDKILQDSKDLPTLPGIALRILELMQCESPEVKDLAEILATDPALSVKVLKLVNSPMYGLTKNITNVFHAVNLLGIHVVKNLALSFSLIRNLNRNKEIGFDYSVFWKSSLLTALTSRILCRKTKPLFAEDAFFLGLISNLGIIAFIHSMPNQYNVVIRTVQNSQCEFQEAEKSVLGITHMEMGSYLFQKWGFPEIFFLPVLYKYNPENIPEEKKSLAHITQILHFSSKLSNFLYSANKSVSFAMLGHYFEEYSFEKDYSIEDIILKLQEQTSNVFSLFDLSLDEEHDYISILEEARRQLINSSYTMTSYILEQKRNIEQLKILAFYDEMTGLINYRKFLELLEKELARSKRYGNSFCLCLSDIDLFKRINDSYGHLVGDIVLKEVAAYLSDNLRASDTIARYGGEEFTFIMPETHCNEAWEVMERLRGEIAKSLFQINGNTISLTMSFGIAEYKAEYNLTGQEILFRADKAMYESKRQGRNKCLIYEDLNESTPN